MARSEAATFTAGLLSAEIYKRNQGRVARQLTAAGLGIVLLSGAWVLSNTMLSSSAGMIKNGIPMGICAIGGWLIFRLYNYPRFAEFLISVEGEMAKVSWASKQEIIRATIVVLTTMVFFGTIMFVYDFFWSRLLSFIGVLKL